KKFQQSSGAHTTDCSVAMTRSTKGRKKEELSKVKGVKLAKVPSKMTLQPKIRKPVSSISAPRPQLGQLIFKALANAQGDMAGYNTVTQLLAKLSHIVD